MPGTPEEFNEGLHRLAGKSRLFPDDIEFLTQCLHSKWYGVQVIAAKVLAKHHPPEGRLLLKGFLMRHLNSDPMLRIAQTALLWCITEADLIWIFELYLTRRSRNEVFLIGALLQFPHPSVIAGVIQDCYRVDNINSITVLARVLMRDRSRILKRLLDDPDVKNKSYLRRAFEWEQPSVDLYRQFGNPL